MGNNNGIKISLPNSKTIKTRNYNQTRFVESILCNDITIGSGAAGTGKTFISIATALSILRDDPRYERLIITRPAVEAGEKIGFLPGDQSEKMLPYINHINEIVKELAPKPKNQQAGRPKKHITDRIEIRPLGYIRGSTFKNCIVILDEAQNTTVTQIKMFTTRIGERAKMIINGDPEQSDLPDHIGNGLSKITDIYSNISGIEVIEFSEDDIVRHHLVKEMLKAFNHKLPKKNA